MTPTRKVVRADWFLNAESQPGGEDAELAPHCAEVVRQICFDATALPVSALQFSPMLEGVLLEAVIEVPNRDVVERVELLTVGRALLCPWVVLQRNGPEYLVRWLRETIANLLAHEVEESLVYRGRRVFNPHAPLG